MMGGASGDILNELKYNILNLIKYFGDGIPINFLVVLLTGQHKLNGFKIKTLRNI